MIVVHKSRFHVTNILKMNATKHSTN